MSKPSATSKASKKNQTTIPARVRRALGIAKGDTLLWVIDGNEVSLRKISKVDINWSKTSEMSLLEWTPEDDEGDERAVHVGKERLALRAGGEEPGNEEHGDDDGNGAHGRIQRFDHRIAPSSAGMAESDVDIPPDELAEQAAHQRGSQQDKQRDGDPADGNAHEAEIPCLGRQHADVV